MKPFLSRSLVLLLLSLAVALLFGPWTDSASSTVSVSKLMATAAREVSRPDVFVEVSAEDYPSLAASAAALADKNTKQPHPSRIRLSEWSKLRTQLELAPRTMANVLCDGVYCTIWYGKDERNFDVEQPYFTAMRRSFGWVMLFFGILLSRPLYVPPPYLSTKVRSRIMIWDLLAVLSLAVSAYLFLEYLATAAYGLTPTIESEIAQIASLMLYVPLLPILAALISLPYSEEGAFDEPTDDEPGTPTDSQEESSTPPPPVDDLPLPQELAPVDELEAAAAPKPEKPKAQDAPAELAAPAGAASSDQ